jgi:hypothetical protein
LRIPKFYFKQKLEEIKLEITQESEEKRVAIEKAAKLQEENTELKKELDSLKSRSVLSPIAETEEIKSKEGKINIPNASLQDHFNKLMQDKKLLSCQTPNTNRLIHFPSDSQQNQQNLQKDNVVISYPDTLYNKTSYKELYEYWYHKAQKSESENLKLDLLNKQYISKIAQVKIACLIFL